MRILREWLHRLVGTLRPRRGDADLAEELRLHAELAAEHGRRIDRPAQAMDALRDQRGLSWADDLVRDVRHGVRSLRRTPAFTAVALLTLALGIGANTAMFSIVNAVILRPLPYAEPDRLLHVKTQFPIFGYAEFWVSPPEYFEFREIARSFSAMGAYRTGEVNLTGADRPRRVRASFVDAHLLETLRLQPAAGRLFTSSETEVTATPTPGQPPPVPPDVAVLSYEVWQSAFGGEPMIGRHVEINGRRREVIGILPRGADLMDQRVEIWLPLGLNPANRQIRSAHNLYLIARLQHGVSFDAAQAELTRLTENWGERTGASGAHVLGEGINRDHVLTLEPLPEEILGGVGRSIWLLQAAVALVLLIAFANLANLLLARAEVRRHEFAVRTSLGAGPARLLRQLTTEGVLLSAAGGALGLVIARLAVSVVVETYPDSLPRTGDLALDPLVLVFTAGVSLGSGMLFGVAPLMHTRVKSLAAAVRERAAPVPAARRQQRVRQSLVVAEIALAVMVVTGAGLLARTVYNLASVDVGFDRSRLVTFSLTLPQNVYPEPPARLELFRRLLERLRALPGVQATTAMSGLPLDRPLDSAQWQIADRPASPEAPDPLVEYNQIVMSGYFDTMGIPIVAGRGFERSDAASNARVVVVNETFARTFWPGQNAIGRRIRPDYGDDQTPWSTVIGVAADVKQGGVDRDTATEVYLFAERGGLTPAAMNVVLRTTLPAAALAQTIERAVQQLDRSVPVARLRTMETVLAESIGRPRLVARLFAAFAALALLLAAIGTYGLLSYLVTQRRRDIGVRLALGADRSIVLAQVMRRGLLLTIAGVFVGLAGALGLNQLISSLLFGVQPTDPQTLTAVAVTMTLIAALACALPAWRASRLDPITILRAE